MQQLIDRAERDVSEGRLQMALRAFVQALTRDPSDSYAWCRTASLLVQLFGDAEALQSLATAAEVTAERGHLLVAIVAQRQLAEREGAMAEEVAHKIAALYGAGSQRLDRGRRAVPPPAPRAVEPEAAEALDAGDMRVLRDEALDACQQASGQKHRPDRLPFFPLFCDLEASDLEKLLPLVAVRQLAVDEEVITQGAEQDRSFYVLARGRLVVQRGDIELARLRDGAFFGEMALLTDSARMATVRCETPGIALRFERETVEALAASNPRVGAVLADYTRRRLLRNLMATSELFAPLPPDRRQALIGLFSPQVFNAGDVATIRLKFRKIL